MTAPKKYRIVIGISGASGVALGIEALRQLKAFSIVETHLVISRSCLNYLHYETGAKAAQIASLADYYYEPEQLDAPIASGSFKTRGMVIIPCSMKTLGGLAVGYADNLLLRAADVHLKEKRPLVLAVRETPFSLIHLNNMVTLTQAGAVIMPPMLTYYHKPENIGEMTVQVVARILEKVGLENPAMFRWGEEK